MKLKDKVTIITGASSGMGRAIAILFAKEGAKVVNADISEEDKYGGQDTVSLIGKDAEFIKTDVSKPEDIDRMVEKTVERFGRVDILVNNAGIPTWSTTLEIPEEEWDRAIAINVKGVFFASQRVAKEMIKQKDGGKIINQSSVASERGTSVAGKVYAASKGCVSALTRQMAMELAPFGIQVNAMYPGMVKTMLFEDQSIFDPDKIDDILKIVPIGEVSEPEDIAGTALFLASPDSDHVTGDCIHVDGGILAGKMR